VISFFTRRSGCILSERKSFTAVEQTMSHDDFDGGLGKFSAADSNVTACASAGKSRAGTRRSRMSRGVGTPFAIALTKESPMETLMQRVVVPIDFSDASERAAVCAAVLARQLGASVHFVHAAEPEDGPRSERDYWAIRHRLVAWSDRIASGIEHSSEIRQGDPTHAITAAVVDYGADLVVMSTHGRSGLSHLLMGSVAEDVIRSVPCPVLVVRDCGQVHVFKPREFKSPGASQGARPMNAHSSPN